MVGTAQGRLAHPSAATLSYAPARGRHPASGYAARSSRALFAERPRTVARHFTAEGDTVIVEAKGDNVTKTGIRYDNDYCMVWRLQNGRVKEIREYCDSALVERVLGPFPAEALAKPG
jgi:ketosteroid isomerase-like protein